jgi:hypothetical protein
MKKQKVLILSRADDEHVGPLVAELEALDHPWICFDPGDFPQQVELTARLGEGTITEKLTLPDSKQIMLDEIGSVWYRRPTPLHADDHLPAMQQIFIEREARAGLWGMLRAIDGVWVNHPDAIREAAYKPRQLSLEITVRGEYHLWSDIFCAYRDWLECGKLGLEAYTLCIDQRGRQIISMDYEGISRAFSLVIT